MAEPLILSVQGRDPERSRNRLDQPLPGRPAPARIRQLATNARIRCPVTPTRGGCLTSKSGGQPSRGWGASSQARSPMPNCQQLSPAGGLIGSARAASTALGKNCRTRGHGSGYSTFSITPCSTSADVDLAAASRCPGPRGHDYCDQGERSSPDQDHSYCGQSQRRSSSPTRDAGIYQELGQSGEQTVANLQHPADSRV
jgi:hypothetical protein